MRTRALLVALGVAMTAYGVVGLLRDASDTHPVRWGTELVAAALVHDLVLAPLVVLLVAGGRRLLPRALRAPAAAALLVGGSLLLVAVPLLGRPGARADNPSLLPRDYGRGLVVLLVVVVGASLAVAVVQEVRRRRSARPAVP